VTSAAAMSRRVSFILLVLLSACSSGGGGGSSLNEILNWPTFRRDPFNSGLGGSSIDKNKGQVRFQAALPAAEGAETLPVPAIGKKLNIYIGTADGLVSLDKDGNETSAFRFCNLADDTEACDTPSETCIEVGPIESTPAVNGKGDLIVPAANGYVFGIHDESVEKKGDDIFTCEWAMPPASPPGTPVLSSPQVILDSIDQAITSVFIGTNNGWLQALNGNNGSEKWRFPANSSPFGALTSTLALSSSQVLYLTAPDGLLYALDAVGRFLWSAPIGVESGPRARLLPSPSVNVSIYAVGAGGSVFAYNPDGTRKWRFQTQSRIFGSPAYLNQFVTDLVNDKEETRLETIVRVVDENGVMYGIRDRTGQAYDAKLCTETTNVTCTTNSDCTDGQTCSLILKCTGSDDRCVSDEDCPSDQTCDSTGERLCSGTDRNHTCFMDSDCASAETCISIKQCSITRESCLSDSDCPGEQTCNSSVRLSTESASLPVSTSPALSSDLYGVVGTEDGRLCARRLDGTVPEDEIWQTGCITIAPGKPLSSPAIDLDGTIYVASDETLYAIGSP
jgi:outer membrane protein assembly factor BamB